MRMELTGAQEYDTAALINEVRSYRRARRCPDNSPLAFGDFRYRYDRIPTGRKRIIVAQGNDQRGQAVG